jgi:CIC family chloride channel protein
MKTLNLNNKFRNCKNSVKCIHLNWIAILKYLFKWIPFSIVVGISVGLTAALFDYLLVLINSFLVLHPYILHIFPFFVAIITGIAISYDIVVAGPGISYVINNIDNKIKFSTLILKFLSSLFALSSVFVAGREGPSFFMGSSISTFIGKFFNIEYEFREYIVLIGAAAFTSALLKAPLGGAIFALEIRYASDMDYKPFPQTLIASIVSYIIFSYFRGAHTLITLHGNTTWNISTLPYLMLLGFAISFFVYLFVTSYSFSTCLSGYIKPIYRPMAGVLLALPVIFIMFEHDVYHILSISVNYQALNIIAQMRIPTSDAILYAILTILLISLTIGFGISGGLILPNLLIGALIGNAFGSFFSSDFTIFTMAGMAAMLAASAKTPIAAIVLMLEISSTDLVIPLTSAVITSYIFTYGINIYTSQKTCRISYGDKQSIY